VNRAHGRFPAFRPNKGLGDDGEETVAQLEVGSTKNVYVRIPGNRVKPEVRRCLARGGAVHVIGAAISVSHFCVPAVARIRPLQLSGNVVSVTAVGVGQQDDAIEPLVPVESTKNRAVGLFFRTESDERAEVDILLGYGVQVFAIETFKSE